jgi:hypothetical protein
LLLLTNDASGANGASDASGASDANGASDASAASKRFRREKANWRRLLPPEALPNPEQRRAKWRRVLLRREEFS